MKHAPLITRSLGYRTAQVLDCIHLHLAQDGQAPSYGMIASEVGLPDRGAVSRIVNRLERRGLVSRVGSGRVRRLRIG